MVQRDERRPTRAAPRAAAGTRPRPASACWRRPAWSPSARSRRPPAAASACRGGRPRRSAPGSAGSSVSMTSVLVDAGRAPASAVGSWPSSTCIASSRLPSVARQAPDHQPRVPAPQPRQRELHLHAALAAHQLVPLVDDDGVHAARARRARCSRVSIRLSDSGVVTSAVGQRRSCCARSAAGVSPVRMPTRPVRGRARRAAPFSARAVSAASARIGVSQRTPQRQAPTGLGRGADRRSAGAARRTTRRRCPHRREPQHAEARRMGGAQRQAESRRQGQRAEPDRVGLARSGGGVQEAAAPCGHRGPDLALESKRLPALPVEPGGGRIGDRGRRRRSPEERRSPRHGSRPADRRDRGQAHGSARHGDRSRTESGRDRPPRARCPCRGRRTALHRPQRGSGRQDADATCAAIEGVLRAAGRRHEIFRVETPASLAAVAERAVAAARASQGMVVAAGGDGTLSAVAQATLGSGCGFAVIPQGTFNYFGRAHGIASDTGRRDAFAARRPAACGAGRAASTTGSSSSTPASASTRRSLEDREEQKRRFGRSRLVAVWAALVTLWRGARPLRIEIEHGGLRRACAPRPLFIGNNRLQLAQLGLPEAQALEDGKLGVVLVRARAALALLWLLLTRCARPAPRGRQRRALRAVRADGPAAGARGIAASRWPPTGR